MALVELSASSPGCYITIHRERRLGEPISDLEAVEKKKLSWFCWESNIDSLVVLIVA